MKKWQKVDPHYFSILEGVYFLIFFPKTTLKCLKMAISLKFSDFRKQPVAQKRMGKYFFVEKIFSTLANSHFGMLNTFVALLEVP